MSVECLGAYRWHKTDHTRLAADPAFNAQDDATVGAYFRLRLICASTNNNGSLSIGAQRRLTEDQVIEYMATWPGNNRPAAKRRMAALKSAGLVKVSKSGVVTISNWGEEQETALTLSAERKRVWREQRKKMLEGELRDLADEEPSQKSDGFLTKKGQRPATGLPPPSPQVSVTGSDSGTKSPDETPDSGGTMSHRQMGHCPTRTEDLRLRPETEKEMNISLNPEPEPEPESQRGTGSGRFARNGEGGGRPVAASLDVWDGDSVDVALRLCGEVGDYARNSWNKRRGDCIARCGGDEFAGDSMFREVLQNFAGILREDRMPKKARDGRPMTRARYLHGMISKRLAGGAP